MTETDPRVKASEEAIDFLRCQLSEEYAAGRYYPLSVEHVAMGLPSPEGYTLPAVRYSQLPGCSRLGDPMALPSRAMLGGAAWMILAAAHRS